MNKKQRHTKEWHAPDTKYGMGDFYGTGIKNPVGKVVRSYMDNGMSSKKLGKPPKSLA